MPPEILNRSYFIFSSAEFRYVALYRYAHEPLNKGVVTRLFWRIILKHASIKYGYEIAPGLRLVHRGGVCINLIAKIGTDNSE